MGNTPTKENTFPLAQLPPAKFEELTSDSYTVLRTSGELEEGFRIPRAGHFCKHEQYASWQHAHAWDGQKESQAIVADQASGNVHLEPYVKWKVHLVKYMEGTQNCDVCGWRTMMPDSDVGAAKPNRTFWPTRLKPEEREAWWLEMDALLRSLQRYADLTPSQRIQIKEADAVRDEEVNGDYRRAIEAKTEEFMKEHLLAEGVNEAERGAQQRIAAFAAAVAAEEAAEAKEAETALAAEKAEYAARHAWWAAFDAEHAELKAAIKAVKDAEGMAPEAAALFAKSVSDDIMGKKQKDVLAEIPDGAPKIWPGGTAVQIWAKQEEKARVLAEVKLAFPDFSLQDQEKRAEYAFQNPEYWAPYRAWLKTTTPEQRVTQMAYSTWARDSPKFA